MNSKRPAAVCIIVENQTVPFDRRVWQEARALREAGYRVFVISPKGPRCESAHETIEGIEIYRHRTWLPHGPYGYVMEYAFALIAEFYLTLRIYIRSRFAILQACNPPDTIFLIAFVFKLLGVRFVFDHHDLSPELYTVKFGRRGLPHSILRLAEWLTFRTADLSIATNESYREIAIARDKMNPERIVVVQTGADLGEVDSIAPDPALKRDKPYMVVYVGVMEVQDGLNLLIKSIQYLVKENHRDDTLFVLIGSGSELPRLRIMTTELDLDDFVEFTGTVSHEEVDRYLSTADVCVAPDPPNPLNERCTMIKNIEYMAHSKPVVLYDLKEGRRTLGDSALYARPGDPLDFAVQIGTLLDSEVLRRKLGLSGRRRVEQELNWKHQSAKFICAFERLISTAN
jgi:glycosyltransferase involved in cell wall biosynthesis